MKYSLILLLLLCSLCKGQQGFINSARDKEQYFTPSSCLTFKNDSLKALYCKYESRGEKNTSFAIGFLSLGLSFAWWDLVTWDNTVVHIRTANQLYPIATCCFAFSSFKFIIGIHQRHKAHKYIQ